MNMCTCMMKNVNNLCKINNIKSVKVNEIHKICIKIIVINVAQSKSALK